MKLITNIVVGFPVLFLLLSIGTGDVGMAISLIAASIICTAGFGLLIWIPLSVMAGGAILAFAHYLSEKVAPQSTNRGTKTNTVSNHQRALIDYLTQTIRMDMSEKDVTELLKNKGWAEKDISEALIQVKRTATNLITDQDSFIISDRK